MSSAGSKRILDADSRLMEWPSFLSEHALGDGLLRRGPKWHAALGAMDGGEALPN